MAHSAVKRGYPHSAGLSRTQCNDGNLTLLCSSGRRAVRPPVFEDFGNRDDGPHNARHDAENDMGRYSQWIHRITLNPCCFPDSRLYYSTHHTQVLFSVARKITQSQGSPSALTTKSATVNSVMPKSPQKPR